MYTFFTPRFYLKKLIDIDDLISILFIYILQLNIL